jgi:hypothetical protein
MNCSCRQPYDWEQPEEGQPLPEGRRLKYYDVYEAVGALEKAKKLKEGEHG